MRKAGFKKTVAAMLAALMVVNTMDSVLPGNPVQAAQPKQETVIQDEQKPEEEVREMTPSVPEEKIPVVSADSLDEFAENLDETMFASRQLLVIANTSQFNTYEAVSIQNFENIYVLSYATNLAAKSAYSKLKKEKGIVSVEINEALKVDTGAINSTSEAPEEVTTEETELGKYLNSLSAVTSVKVAILDTGLNTEGVEGEYEDAGADYTSEKMTSLYDDNGHGTEMAQLIHANSNHLVKIEPIKVADSQGRASVLNTYLGIKKAIESNADIINISMTASASTTSHLLTEALDEAVNKGIVVVVSAGNLGIDTANVSPANVDSAVVVSATSDTNEFAGYSNYGNTVDYSSYGSYNGKNGTSYAAARVSGMIADALSKGNGVETLDKYAIDLGNAGTDPLFGKGFVGKEIIRNGSEHYSGIRNNKIFKVNWKSLSDEELNLVIQETSDEVLSVFLASLSENELSDIVSRDTDLNKPRGEILLNKDGDIVRTSEYVYYKGLLNDDLTVSGGLGTIHLSNSNEGYVYVYDNLKKKSVKISVKSHLYNGTVTDKGYYSGYLNCYTYISSSDTGVYDLYTDKMSGEKLGDNYKLAYGWDSVDAPNIVYVPLTRKSVPSGYKVTSSKQKAGPHDDKGSDYIKVNQYYSNRDTQSKHDTTFLLEFDTNSAGISKNNISNIYHHELQLTYGMTNPTPTPKPTKKPTNTPTPKPTNTPTPTPIPKYIQTVKHFQWNPADGNWKLKDTDSVKIERGKRFNPSEYVKSYTGYHMESITLQNGNPIGEYTVWSDTIVHINYMPNQSTLQVDPNGGTWNGSTEVQSFTQSYGTTLDIPVPTRDKYEFHGWSQQITNGSLDNTTYKFGPNAGVTDYLTAQWEAWGFKIKYERNEPSGIGKLPMQPQDELNIESQENIYDVGFYENAKFIGWCLAIGNRNENTEELTSVQWLKEDGTFDGTETQKGKKRFDTDGYTGKIFQNLASVQEFVPYITENNQELTLVGMWTIDVDYDAEDGTNTAALAAGQHGIAPDKTFTLVNEAPSLMGNEFVQWIDPTQQAINNAGKSFVETGKTMDMLVLESKLTINGKNNTWGKGGSVDDGFGNDKILYATYRYYIQYQKADGTIIEKDNVTKKKEFEQDYGEATTISDVTYPTNGNTEGHHYTSEKLWQVTADNSERYKYADASNYPGKNYSNSYKQGATAIVNRSVILKAAEEANTYTIKYNANSNAASTKHLQDWSRMTDQKIIYGESVSLKGITGSELPGYTFAGWNTKADGTGVSFSDRESSTVKQFLSKAGKNVDENGAVVQLYAQWKAKSYTITFDVNRPSAANNTHASSNAPVFNGTATMEYVWDSVITNNKIEDLNIPLATLKGWHQRFSDSLWYTGNKYNAPGIAMKNGTKLGYETLGTPGNKTVYAQWEANTYTIEYDGNGVQSGGRGRVQGIVEPQILTYDKTEKLKENAYKKQDETYQYHDDEKISENLYHTKYNKKAVDSFKYDWLGWCRKRLTEGKDGEPDKSEMISQADIETEKMWNLTDIDKDKIVLYAFWDGIPNITTKSEKTHFDRYQGAHLSAADMKKLVKSYDLEQGEELKIIIKNISYYVNGSKIESVDYPKDNYMLDTTLPKEMWEDGKYKTYTITFETVDKYQVNNYMGEQPQKEAIYLGRIYYNNEPVIEPCNEDGIFHERYLYLQEIKEMEKKELEAVLLRHIRMEDKEDTEYEKNRQNDLYLGRWYEEAKVEIVQLSDIWKKAENQEENWNAQEKAEGKTMEYIVQYTDIFGKCITKDNKLHIIDSEHDSCGGNDKRKQSVRFISKEYLDTLEQESQWYQEEENRKELENILNNGDASEEIYELQKKK